MLLASWHASRAPSTKQAARPSQAMPWTEHQLRVLVSQATADSTAVLSARTADGGLEEVSYTAHCTLHTALGPSSRRTQAVSMHGTTSLPKSVQSDGPTSDQRRRSKNRAVLGSRDTPGTVTRMLKMETGGHSIPIHALLQRYLAPGDRIEDRSVKHDFDVVSWNVGDDGGSSSDQTTTDWTDLLLVRSRGNKGSQV